MENLSRFLQKYKKGYFLEKEAQEEIKKHLLKKGLGENPSALRLKISFKKETLLIHTSPGIKHYLLLHQKEIFLLLKTFMGREFTKML
ncbi:MAG: hypothetical protein AAB545_03470 [Patescibacteria group bacterium]